MNGVQVSLPNPVLAGVKNVQIADKNRALIKSKANAIRVQKGHGPANANARPANREAISLVPHAASKHQRPSAHPSMNPHGSCLSFRWNRRKAKPGFMIWICIPS